VSSEIFKRASQVAASVLLSAALLTACASGSGGDDSLTLAETKSPAQLLRNEAANRVPADQVEAIIKSQDESTSCRTVETDPDGLLRSWHSAVRFQLVNDASVDPDAVLETLVNSFVDDGWTRGSFGVETIVELTQTNSETTIHVSVSRPDPDGGAQIQLAVAGPCVMTDGRESAEVTSLGDVNE